MISIPIGLLLAMIKKESPNEGTKTLIFCLTSQTHSIKKESPNEGTKTPAQILHFRRIIKKESPNEGTKTSCTRCSWLRS